MSDIEIENGPMGKANAAHSKAVYTIFVYPDAKVSAPRFVTPDGEVVKRMAMPIRVCCSAKCGPKFKDAVKAAMDKWSAASSNRLSFQWSARQLLYSDHNVITFDYLASGWIGDDEALAYTWFPEGFAKPDISYTRTVLNARHVEWHSGSPAFVAAVPKTKPPFNKDKADYENTVLHEMGHALGLDHSTDPNSVMWPYIHDGGNVLNKSDVAAVNALYK